MQVVLAERNGKPVILELRGTDVFIDGQQEPIKNLAEAELAAFQEELDNLPDGDAEAKSALTNSVRAAFLAKLLGKAVGDDCVDRLSHLLDHVHYDVLKYLGETEE